MTPFLRSKTSIGNNTFSQQAYNACNLINTNGSIASYPIGKISNSQLRSEVRSVIKKTSSLICCVCINTHAHHARSEPAMHASIDVCKYISLWEKPSTYHVGAGHVPGIRSSKCRISHLVHLRDFSSISRRSTSIQRVQ